MELEEDERNESRVAGKNARRGWDAVHQHYERSKIQYDDWLQQFEEYIHHCATPIIDLGCGSGNDTLYLIEHGKTVIPCDYSQNAIQNIERNFPEVEKAMCFDMTKGLPFPDNFTEAMICDLSLHYFTEKDTFKVLDEIKRVLKPDGVVLYRINSTKDVNHGAGQGKEIEHHLYETKEGTYKRFFDEQDINKFFEGWNILYLHEETMGRYRQRKSVVERCGTS